MKNVEKDEQLLKRLEIDDLHKINILKSEKEKIDYAILMLNLINQIKETFTKNNIPINLSFDFLGNHQQAEIYYKAFHGDYYSELLNQNISQ